MICSAIVLCLTSLLWALDGPRMTQIRPHRFGGEGVLIGVQFGYAKCSSHICLYSSRYISFSWGGPLKFSHRNPSSAVVFVIFRTIFGRWIWRGYWDGILGRFGRVLAIEKRTWEASGNGKTDNNEKNCKYRCFQRIWDVRVLNTLQKPVFWTDFMPKNV